MERNYKLYVHTTPNGKRYYGITKQNPNNRWRKGKGYKNNQYFTSAINKYGWNNIKHEVLFDNLTESEAKELEQYMIQWYDTANHSYGYNLSLGGEGGNVISRNEETKQKISESLKGKNNPMYGKHHTEKTKQKLSEINKGKHLSEETKNKIGESHKGRKHTEESKRKMSEALKGETHTEETKQKISKVRIEKGIAKGENNPMYGTCRSGKNSGRKKSVICLTTKTIFYTTVDAAKCYGIKNESNISRCCKRQLNYSGKHNGQKLVWRYLNHRHNKIYRINYNK